MAKLKCCHHTRMDHIEKRQVQNFKYSTTSGAPQVLEYSIEYSSNKVLDSSSPSV